MFFNVDYSKVYFTLSFQHVCSFRFLFIYSTAVKCRQILCLKVTVGNDSLISQLDLG